jgi:murein DD-endopeptidase MepM/ murein hydrolase activator NlpD
VAKSSVSWAGGLQLTIQGSRGFVFNVHLTAFDKTGKVKAGDVVGYVGNTGDAQGGSTHDHFEWHPKNGPAVDAYGLLRQACRTVPRRTRPPAEPRRMA